MSRLTKPSAQIVLGKRLLVRPDSGFAPSAMFHLLKIDSGPQFAMDDDRVDLSNRPLTPMFDASHIFAGQSVMPINESGGMIGNSVGTITVSDLYREERGFRGTTESGITPGTGPALR